MQEHMRLPFSVKANLIYNHLRFSMSRPYHFLRLVSLYPLTQILQSQQANLFITWFLELLYYCSHIIAWKDLLILGKPMPLPSFKTLLFQKVFIDYLHPAVTHFPSSSLKYWLLLIYLYLFCHFAFYTYLFKMYYQQELDFLFCHCQD